MVVVVVLARKRREVAMMPISCLGLTIPDSLERDGHQSFEKESENERRKRREVAIARRLPNGVIKSRRGRRPSLTTKLSSKSLVACCNIAGRAACV